MSPETLARLYRRLEEHEDRRHRVYVDSRGNRTLGIGHLAEYGQDIALTDTAIDAILEGDVADKIRLCERRLLCWPALDEVRQAACIELAFNGALFASPKAIAALNLGDYEEAARHLLDGPWKDQVGARAHVLARQIETGEWA